MISGVSQEHLVGLAQAAPSNTKDLLDSDVILSAQRALHFYLREVPLTLEDSISCLGHLALPKCTGSQTAQPFHYEEELKADSHNQFRTFIQLTLRQSN